MRFSCLAAFAAVLFAGAARAEPPAAPTTQATARAKAALALAAAGKKPAPTIALAPAPRVVLRTWGEAQAASVRENRPVIVYVGCDLPEPADQVPGTYAVSLPELKGYAPRTIVVCYPRGGKMWPDGELPCDAPTAEVKEAVKEAVKKTPAALPKKPLDWS